MVKSSSQKTVMPRITRSSSAGVQKPEPAKFISNLMKDVGTGKYSKFYGIEEDRFLLKCEEEHTAYLYFWNEKKYFKGRFELSSLNPEKFGMAFPDGDVVNLTAKEWNEEIDNGHLVFLEAQAKPYGYFTDKQWKTFWASSRRGAA